MAFPIPRGFSVCAYVASLPPLFFCFPPKASGHIPSGSTAGGRPFVYTPGDLSLLPRPHPSPHLGLDLKAYRSCSQAWFWRCPPNPNVFRAPSTRPPARVLTPSLPVCVIFRCGCPFLRFSSCFFPSYWVLGLCGWGLHLLLAALRGGVSPRWF